MSDNTGSNLGTGQGVFSGKVGDDLQFKSLVGGSSITLTADANEITINSSALVSTATNLGSGTGLFVDLTTGSLNFRGIALGTGADSGLKISSNATTILLSIDSANLDAGTLGGLASSAFLQKSDNLAAVTNVATARTNLGVYSKTETDAKYFANDINSLPATDNAVALGDNSKRFSDVYAVEFHGTATRSGVVTSIADHDIGSLQNVDETGKASGHVLKYNGSHWVSVVDAGATNLGALTDVEASGAANGQVLMYISANSRWEAGTVSGGGGGGSSTFVGLTDSPSNYSGAGNYFLKVNSGASAIEFVADPGYVSDLSTFTTANLTENTNLYFTDARADARIAAASINALSDVDTSGVSTNDVLKWNGSQWTPTTDAGGIALTDISTTTGAASGGGTLSYNNGSGVFTFAPADLSSFITASSTETLTNKSGAISMFTNDSGYLTGITGQSINSLSDVDTSGISSGQVLSWDGSSFIASSSGTGTVTSVVAGTGLTGGTITASGTIAVDVGTTADKIVQLDGSARLPAVDGSQLTNLPAQSFASLTGKPTTIVGYGITDAFDGDYNNLSNKPTIPSAYANSDVDAHLNQSNPTAGYVLSWNGSDYAWVDNGVSGASSFTGLTDTPANYTGGANKFVKVNSAGNALEYVAEPGYLTSVPAQSFASLTGKPTTIAGYGITDGYADSDADARIVAAGSANWNTAFGWGDHSTAGYLTSVPAQSFASLTGKPTTLAGYGITDAVSGAGLNALIDGHLNQSNPTSGYVLSWNGSDYAWISNSGYTNTDFDNRLATKDTGDLAEGSNLYYTDTRADARISNAVLSALSNVHTAAPTDGQVLKWDNGNSRWAPANDTDTVYTSFNTDFDTRLGTKDTGDLAEGSNQYFTQARARGSISLGSAGSQAYNNGTGVLTIPGTTDHITEGSNLFYTTTRANTDFDTRLATKSTTDLAEGSNLYYTDARADARITNALIDEDNMASDSATRIPSQQSVKAYVDSQVASENELSEMNDVTITSVQNNDFIKYNSSTSRWENASVTAATAAGNDTHVQFNDGGVMGGDSGFTYNKTTDALTVGSISTTGASGSVSSTADLDITTSANNSNIGIVPHGTGDIELGTNVLIDGSDNGYLKWTAPYSTEGDLPSASTYHGMFAHVHGTGKGYFAHGGNWIKLIDETSSTTDNLSEGSSNLYYTDTRANSAFDTRLATKNTGDLTEGSNLYYTDTRADARITAALIDEDNMASDSATRLPSQQSVKAYVDSSTANSSNWDTAYGWGNHASAGYLTSFTETNDLSSAVTWANVPNANITESSVTQHQAALSITESQISDLGTYQTVSGLNGAIDGHLNQSNPTAGYVLSWSGSDYAWVDNAGYSNSDVDTHLNQSNPTSGYVLSWNGSDYAWVAQSGGSSSMNTAGNTGTGSVAFASETLTVTGQTGQINVDASAFALSLSLASDINSITSIAFEGSTADTNETKLQAVDPTADRTINLPDASGHLPVFATASPAAITDGTNGQALVTDGNGQLSFTTISSGSSLTVQDEGSSLSTAATTLNFVGAGVTASGTGATKTITIAGGGGSGGTEYEEFKINYATNGTVSSISDTSSGISSVNIDSAAGGDLTVNFTGYTTPPLSFAMYGYNYAANKYNYNTVASGSMTLRELPGGGSSGSPTAFGSFSNMQIRCSESETGASRSFGTTTHAWVRFVMGA